MEIKVERKWKKDTYTIGRLYIDDQFYCNSLEDTDRGLRQDMNVGEITRIKNENIGETAIPTGRYKVVLSYSNKFKRTLPQIMNVKGYTGVRIHRGNTAKDSLGCILVGKNTAKGMVTESAKTEIALVKLLQQQKDINLTIE